MGNPIISRKAMARVVNTIASSRSVPGWVGMHRDRRDRIPRPVPLARAPVRSCRRLFARRPLYHLGNHFRRQGRLASSSSYIALQPTDRFCRVALLPPPDRRLALAYRADDRQSSRSPPPTEAQCETATPISVAFSGPPPNPPAPPDPQLRARYRRQRSSQHDRISQPPWNLMLVPE